MKRNSDGEAGPFHAFAQDIFLPASKWSQKSSHKKQRTAVEENKDNNCYILLLPKEILRAIFSMVTFFDWFNVRLVCKLWNELGDQTFDPSAFSNRALRHASAKGYLHLVEKLLKDPRVNQAVWEFDTTLELLCPPIVLAASNGHEEIVKVLLNDSQAEPSAGFNAALISCCEKGRTSIVQILLHCPLLDLPKDSYAMSLAAIGGHSDVVNLLLEDGRVDPNREYAGRNALEWAYQGGHLKVVRELLKDSRVNSSESKNWPSWCEHC